MKLIYLFYLIIFLYSCKPSCNPTHLDMEAIPDEILNKVPYEDGKIYRFQHSGGKIINFTASRSTSVLTHYDYTNCQYTFDYQENKTHLSPDYPVFDIDIVLHWIPLFPVEEDPFLVPVWGQQQYDSYCHIGNSAFEYVLDTSQLKQNFNFPSYDTNAEKKYLDSVFVDSVLYDYILIFRNDIFVNTGEFQLKNIDSIYFNYDVGLIKIFMSNGEYYKIYH
ncbi:hypothetical protein ACE01N_07090 [Saccharicrinis sp. FJH2]|uniref:hypothetical protein n=1 Tax=Saccharicrinis sp. FJH65 TaxID=3344659 RepID=UPI0035F37F03